MSISSPRVKSCTSKRSESTSSAAMTSSRSTAQSAKQNMPKKVNTPDKFWSWAHKGYSPDDCWLWLVNEVTKYAQVYYRDRRWYVHHLAYTLTKGPITTGLFVCHTCDCPNCISPEHLFLGTHQDNMDDKTAKGRAKHMFLREPFYTGHINHCKNKINTNTQEYIRDLYNVCNYTMRDLARMFDRCPATIYRILREKARYRKEKPHD
jgi:hypothetical protein